MAHQPDIVGMSHSFQPRMWFPHGFDAECGGRIMWVYRTDSEGNFIVGYFLPNGEWFADGVFDNKEEAASRVNWLNGGNAQ